MLTANDNKIEKSSLSCITFMLNVLSENGFISVWMDLFVKIKKMLISQKRVFKNEVACACVNILRHECVLYGTTHLFSYIVIKKL